MHFSFERYFSRLSSTRSITYVSQTKLSWKVNTIIISLKHNDLLLITIITIIMQNQAGFCPYFTEVNTNSFFGKPKLPLRP